MRWPYYLAHLYRQRGDRDPAADFFARALALEPANLAALVWLGRMELDRGRPAAAAAAFERALAVDPASAAALAGAGRSALAVRDAGRAVGYLERALALAPVGGEPALQSRHGAPCARQSRRCPNAPAAARERACRRRRTR